MKQYILILILCLGLLLLTTGCNTPTTEPSTIAPTSDYTPETTLQNAETEGVTTENSSSEPTSTEPDSEVTQVITNNGTVPTTTEAVMTEPTTAIGEQQATTLPTEPTSEPETTEPEATVPPTTAPITVTYPEYLAMSGTDQAAFIESFGSYESFFAWLNAAQAEYEDQRIPIDGTTPIAP